MSRYILVLGVNGTEGDTWGGIIDVEKESPDEDEGYLFGLIQEAEDEKAKFTNLICGSSSAEAGQPNVDSWEHMPFSGTVEDQVLIYVD